MHSFVDLERTLGSQPARLGARLARLDVGSGREGLYRDRLPELLQALANETRVASIAASSAIEGVTVAADRIEGLARAGAEPRRFRNRNEREFAGYRDAVDEIMGATTLEPISVPYILHLHRQIFRFTDAGGGRLQSEQNLIASYEHGHKEILFTPPSPKETPFILPELVDRYRSASEAQAAHPILLIAAFILDFPAIHPVADGNGRLARLLTTHALLERGYGVARYVSIEQRMFETKNAYYAALYASQREWHEGLHDVWPWAAYLVGILEASYDDFEARLAARRSLAGMSKQARVREFVLHHGPVAFRLRDLRAVLPGISDPTLRLALNELRREGLVELDTSIGGSGRNATWRRTDRAAP